MSNLKGILMMLAAMAAFTMEDLFIKKLSAGLTTGQILVLLGIGGGTVFAIVAKSKGYRLFNPNFWQTNLVLRAAAEGMGAIAFVTALSLVPISTVAAVFQVTPLVITMGAAMFLAEDVGWRRWLAIIGGFVGVLIIIRPGLDGFDANVLLVLMAVFCIASRDLITRRMPESVPSVIVSFQAFLGVIVAGGVMMFLRSDEIRLLSTNETGFVLAGICFGVAGYYCLVAATRIGEASAVTPFRYARLIFSLVVGFIVFNERPDMLTLLGASIVIAMGVYTFWRERIVAQQ